MNNTHSYHRFLESWRARHEPGAIRMLSILYWRTLVIISTLLFVLMLLIGWWELQTTLTILSKLNEPPKNQPAILTRKDVDTTVAMFDARASTYERLKRNPPSVPDPSQ